MLSGGLWIAKFLHDFGIKVDVAPLPKGKERATISTAWPTWSGRAPKILPKPRSGSSSSGVKEAKSILAKTGTVIPAYKGMQQDWVKAIPDMKLQVFIDALGYAVPYPTTPVGPEWSWKIMETFGQVWAGNLPINQACSTAARRPTRP